MLLRAENGQKGHFGQSVLEKGPPKGHLLEKRRYPELLGHGEVMIPMSPVHLRLKKWVIWGQHKKLFLQFFGRKSFFLSRHPKFGFQIFLLPSWRDTKKARFLCWTHCTEVVGAAAEAHFWPENIHFFAAHPYNPHFLGLHESDPMES